MTLQDIFTKMGEREWDKSQHLLERYYPKTESGEKLFDPNPSMTLADLLVNKSWCKAVWGKERKATVGDVYGWKMPSRDAFHILQQSGESECLDFIHRTMI